MSSEAESGGQEKSFEASKQKIRKSREQGDVPQSTEINTFLLYLSVFLVVIIFGGGYVKGIFTQIIQFISQPDEIAHQTLMAKNGTVLREILSTILVSTFAILTVPGIVIIAGLAAQRSIVFAPVKIKPKLSKVSPISNAKQKYGPNGLVEFFNRMAKLIFVAILALFFFYQAFPTLPNLSHVSAQNIGPGLNERTQDLLIYMIIASAIIAAIDLPYKRFSHFNKLRMTRQEVRDEMKDSEGDPHMKQARRARAAAIAQTSMLQDIVSSDVIIVNPTHYAVALKWERDKGGVPICIAKGVDEIAARIRKQADIHDVPIHSNPSCARSLYATVEVGETIRPEHYAAVAAAIHFADQFKAKPY